MHTRAWTHNLEERERVRKHRRSAQCYAEAPEGRVYAPKYNVDGKRHATYDGKPHVVTPVGITFSDGYYYLTAWNDDHDAMTEFRIDRMKKLKVSDERATRNEQITHRAYEGDGHESFGRFIGEPTTATPLVDADKIEIIMDRFGR